MKLKVISSSSKGNCYVLESDSEALLLECGVEVHTIKKALDFKISKVVGCCLSHEHGDHAKGIKGVIGSGIDVYSSEGTLKACGVSGHRVKVVRCGNLYQIGSFRVLPFDVKHDAQEPFGYLIDHEECGTVLFATDTYYLPVKFPGVTNIICEVNYSEEILAGRVSEGKVHPALRRRILSSHMSLETFKKTLSDNDLSGVNNIVMIHLSDGNSNAELFKKTISEFTGKNVHVADKGMQINFNKTPF